MSAGIAQVLTVGLGSCWSCLIGQNVPEGEYGGAGGNFTFPNQSLDLIFVRFITFISLYFTQRKII